MQNSKKKPLRSAKWFGRDDKMGFVYRSFPNAFKRLLRPECNNQSSTEIETLARKEAPCQRLMTVPGIGPVISSATVATIGTGDMFAKGRDFGAWLGMVPKQHSTGGRAILSTINLFALDALVNMVIAAGLRIEMRVLETA